MKEVLTIYFLLVLTACRHVEPESRTAEPERRSTEAALRQHIVGEWTLSDKSGGLWFPKMIIAADGSFTLYRLNGKKALSGTWECQGRMLKVNRNSNDWDYFPLVFADEHELVMTPGISVAGRLRFTK